MLQDYLSGRAAINPEPVAPEPATPGGDDFQSLFAARAAGLAQPEGSRRIEEIPVPEMLDSPRIELVEENGRAQRIIVICTCCKRIEIECEY